MTQPIQTGAVISRVWDIYREQAGVLLPAALVLFGLQFVIAILLPIGLALLLSLLFWVLAILYQGFVVELVNDVERGGRQSTMGSLVEAVTPVLGPLLVISILFAIGVTIGLILIIVPGLILLTIWSVVVPVAVLERPGILASFARSRELVRGNGWNVFGVIVIIVFATLVISLLAGIIAAPLGHVGRDLVQWAFNVVLAPVVALSASVLYFALRGTGAGTPAPGVGGPTAAG